MVTRPTLGRLSSPYGWRVHPITGARSFHTGSDYGHTAGTRLVAPIACRVLSYGLAGGYGNRMVLGGQHDGRDVVIWLNHLADDVVAWGEHAAEGDDVAIMGTTGNSTGVHLHLEVFVDGVRVDPEAWLVNYARTATAGGTATPIEKDDDTVFHIIKDVHPEGGTYLAAPGGKGVVHVRNPTDLAVLERVKRGERNFTFAEVQLVESYMQALDPVSPVVLDLNDDDLEALAAKVAALVKVPTTGTLTLK